MIPRKERRYDIFVCEEKVMKNILKFITQNKRTNIAYVIMFGSLMVGLCFIFIGNEIMVEILGISAFVSLTTGVLIEFLLVLTNKI